MKRTLSLDTRDSVNACDESTTDDSPTNAVTEKPRKINKLDLHVTSNCKICSMKCFSNSCLQCDYCDTSCHVTCLLRDTKTTKADRHKFLGGLAHLAKRKFVTWLRLNFLTGAPVVILC